MHETALMENMLAVALQQLSPYQVKRVNRVVMKVGRLANVLPEALSFAFSAATTAAGPAALFAGAELILENLPYRARCHDCAQVYQSRDLPPACPACGGHGVDILDGAEVYLDSIDFDVEESHRGEEPCV